MVQITVRVAIILVEIWKIEVEKVFVSTEFVHKLADPKALTKQFHTVIVSPG